MTTDFGPAVRPAADTAAATWLLPWLWAMHGQVGDLLPIDFERYLFVDDMDEDEDQEAWDRAQANAATIADVAAHHTATPDAAFFAVWVGHGYSNAGLSRIPTFQDPGRMREYFLLAGPVGAVTELTEPNPREHEPWRWRQPDLWWPDDHAWMVATDVDIGCTYVGGTADLVDELAATLTTETHVVQRTDDLERFD